MYVYGYDASLNVKNSFPVFSTHIEANFVSKREDIYSMHALTDDDKARVLELSRDSRIGESHRYVLWLDEWLLGGWGGAEEDCRKRREQVA